MTGRGQSLVLIGFMGVGKSSTGHALAARTGLPCVDTDEIVTRELGMSVSEIFASWGEEKFREIETVALRQLNETPRGIIVTGGGIVLRSENVQLLRKLGKIVSLEADNETLFRRISQVAPRPLLQTEDPRATILELLRIRTPLYHQAADIRVDTSSLTVNEVAEIIVQRIEEK